jgi:phosphoglycolate phosphatase-like HAD superfamily hydrolase
VDGVLIDAGESFPEAVRMTVEREWRAGGYECDAPGYSREHNSVLKRHGSFNDDYDIAWTLLNISAHHAERLGNKLSDAMPSPEELGRIIGGCIGSSVDWTRAEFGERFGRRRIRDSCAGAYFGEGESEGTCSLERACLSADWRDLPLPAYVYTGRDEREWRMARRTLSWGDFPDERVVHSGTGMLKPSPDGIDFICGRFGHARPLYFGDTESDRMAQLSSGKGWFVAVGEILTSGELWFGDVSTALSKLTGWMR